MFSSLSKSDSCSTLCSQKFNTQITELAKHKEVVMPPQLFATTTICITNVSVYSDCEFYSTLRWAVDELREQDFFSIASDADRIDEIERICSAPNEWGTPSMTTALVLMGDLLLQYALADGAFYFYFAAARMSIENKQKESLHTALLQMAKMLLVGAFKTSPDATIAKDILLLLINNFSCEEASSYYFNEAK